MSAISTEPVTGPAIWTGSELEQDRSWEYRLDDAQRRTIERSMVAVAGRPIEEITAADFPIDGLEDLVADIEDQLRDGRGMALLHGFPVEGHELGVIERGYWGLLSHLGTGITQNSDAGLIHHVTDGTLRPQQGSRGVGSPGRTGLHVDLTDVASLLCVQQAPDDPHSWLASSATVFNEVLRRRPEVLPALFEGFQWDRMGEHRDNESATSGYLVPLFSEADGRISCRYNRAWIASAARRLDRRFTPAQKEVFNLLDAIADEHRLAFPFHRGDIQFVNNYAVLHGRDAHDLVETEEHKRLLLRIWLDLDDIRPFADEAIVRYGIVRHGNLGWPAERRAEALAGACHARSAEGVPALP